MKTAFLGILALTMATTAFAETGLTAQQAQHEVIAQANRYISENAPDFGGKVKSTEASLSGDRYTVTVKGMADRTMAGDGDWKTYFTCVGEFNQGNDGLFFEVGSIHCK